MNTFFLCKESRNARTLIYLSNSDTVVHYYEKYKTNIIQTCVFTCVAIIIYS